METFMPKQANAHLDTEKRPQRVSMADQPKNILTVLNKDDDYVYRWLRKEPDRMYRAAQGGYDIVTYGDLKIGDARIPATGNKEKNAAVEVPGGQGTTLVLHRIKREYYDEDQAKKQAEIDEREMQMVSAAQQGRYGRLTIGEKI